MIRDLDSLPESFHRIPQPHWIPLLLLELVDELRRIRVILTPRLSAGLRLHPVPSAAQSQPPSHKGDHMPVTLLVGQTATSTWQEWSGPNGTGDKLPPAGAVTYSSSNTAVATVDPNSGLVTAIALGSATISGTDAANSLTASDTATVTEVAQSSTLTLTASTNPPATPAAKKAA